MTARAAEPLRDPPPRCAPAGPSVLSVGKKQIWEANCGCITFMKIASLQKGTHREMTSAHEQGLTTSQIKAQIVLGALGAPAAPRRGLTPVPVHGFRLFGDFVQRSHAPTLSPVWLLALGLPPRDSFTCVCTVIILATMENVVLCLFCGWTLIRVFPIWHPHV